MSEHGTSEGHGASIMIPGNGDAVPFIDTLAQAYTVDEHSRTDNVDRRAGRIHTEVGSIEDLLKDVLVTKDKEGKVVSDPNAQATEAQANLIAGKLAYSLAKVLDEYKGSPSGLDEMKVDELLGRAASAIGDPSVGSKSQLVMAILSMATPNPKSHKYDRNGPLARLINYIATEADSESKGIRYAQTQLSQAWQM
ncbi:hypothetical protein HYX09_02695, partial [Candidatus Woesearchaeota archaeon]|nr:hypothetical protein [Candidatus Woesearchaeota archaeon]